MTRPVGPVSALFVFIIAVVCYGEFIRPHTLRGAVHPPSVTSQAAPDERDNVEVELITLRTYGFEPSEITRPKGSFVLFVEDRSGRKDSTLRLQRLKGDHLRNINTSRMKDEWHDLINLTPGEYILTEGNNPDSRCQITILP